MFGGWVARRVDEEVAKLNDTQAGLQILEEIRAGSLLGDDLTGTDADTKQRRELLQSLTIEELRSSVRRLQSDYEELAKMAELPFAERGPKYAAFQAGLDQSRKLASRDDLMRCLSIYYIPSFKLISQRLDGLHVRRTLLDLAIQVQLHSPDAVQAATIHEVKVEYHKTDTGFELRCQLPGSDKPETLLVPAKK